MENPPDSSADTAVALQERLKKKYVFQFPDDEADVSQNVKQEMRDDENVETTPPPLTKPTGATMIPSDDEQDTTKTSRWQSTITSGEPQVDPDFFAPQSYDTDHHWDPEGRPPWQRHSELGPNLEAQAKQKTPEAMQDSVNPEDFDWQKSGRGMDLSHLRTTWENAGDGDRS